jgi:hypothetical protein
LQIQQLAVLNDVKLIDPFLFEQMTPYLHDNIAQQLRNEGLAGTNLSSAINLIDEKIAQCENAIGEEILTIGDLTNYLNNDIEKMILDQDADSAETICAQHNLIQNRFLAFFDEHQINVTNNYY